MATAARSAASSAARSRVVASLFERRIPWAVVALLWGVSSAVAAVEVSRSGFGTLADGKSVEAVTFTNKNGVMLRVMTLGASVQALEVPDRNGKLEDVVLGYDSLPGYLAKPQYFGATVGRFANRIAAGRFTLDGHGYQVPKNDGPNSLHGGPAGFDKALWTVRQLQSGPAAAVTLELKSPDGDAGFPGTLDVTAKYSLNDRNEVSVEYRATTDKATIVNLSNHTYFNLAGEGASRGVMDHLLRLPAGEITPVDATLIPTGEFRRVAGTVFDFRVAKAIGRDIRDVREQQLIYGRGYDHNWVVSRAATREVRLVAHVEDPVSGRVLDVLSDQPGLQFYSGNFLDGTTVGKSGHTYRQGDAFVLEPQRFPDSPNHADFGSARLDPGSEYLNRIVLRFSTDKG
jgi:aldose 1-epimerase